MRPFETLHSNHHPRRAEQQANGAARDGKGTKLRMMPLANQSANSSPTVIPNHRCTGNTLRDTPGNIGLFLLVRVATELIPR
jgi:hypothetical protein